MGAGYVWRCSGGHWGTGTQRVARLLGEVRRGGREKEREQRVGSTQRPQNRSCAVPNMSIIDGTHRRKHWSEYRLNREVYESLLQLCFKPLLRLQGYIEICNTFLV